ncbi:MAG: alpha-glucuronidase family glycosyl hydrolase [Terriglobales bacterium]
MKHLPGLFLAVALWPVAALAVNGQSAWLRYPPLPTARRVALARRLPARLEVLAGRDRADAALWASAAAELRLGSRAMLGRARRLGATTAGGATGAIVLVDSEALATRFPGLAPPHAIAPEGYWLRLGSWQGQRLWLIAGDGGRGVLYGVFALLRRMELGGLPPGLSLVSNPSAPIRWVDEWDNLNGTIERGYGGRSIFFTDGHVRPDLSRVRQYARLLASLGINGCVVNNVNADPRILTPSFVPQLARLAAAMRPWGVRLGISAPLNAPKAIGGLATFDPLDPKVAAWWRQKADALYRRIPDLAGFLVKADSEGQSGPAAYGRTQAQAANVLARALAPHGGIVMYRAFIYKYPLNWNDPKADRAKAAYRTFAPLDGRFDRNVVVQIKYGPMDFQVREPVSPLIGALRHTNQALELEITQEYTGQQRQVFYWAPLWRHILSFDLQANGAGTKVRQLVTGRTFHRPLGGFAGVANVGMDANWMGSYVAQANVYAFGRLAWNPRLRARAVARQWARLSFGSRPRVVATVTRILMDSWPTYEDYTGSPLGLQTLTNILTSHYGPGPQSADHNGWGQWIRAGRCRPGEPAAQCGIGMDRTVATGTGFLGEYAPAVARRYASLATCPQHLLLFFHHLPYTYRLRNGRTIIQEIYDSHYAGAAEAARWPRWWLALRPDMQGAWARRRYGEILHELRYQAGYAIVWRDYINEWFFHLTGIPDALGRVGHHPDRVEAEAMQLTGYRVEAIHPWEAASGGKAVVCPAGRRSCTARFVFDGAAGRYDLAVEYFDPNDSVARYALKINGRRPPVAGADWVGNRQLPTRRLNADSALRHTLRGVRLRPGERISVTGSPGGGDSAAVDYVAICPVGPPLP